MIFAGVNGTEGVETCRRNRRKWQTLFTTNTYYTAFGLSRRRLQNDGPKIRQGRE